MDLRQSLEKVGSEYGEAKLRVLTANPLALFIRQQFPSVISKVINDEDLEVRASAGRGGWAESPWAAILNKEATDGPQEGIYVVYLFSGDLKYLHLSLAQGITRPIQRHGRRKARVWLRANAEYIRANFELDDFDDYNLMELGTGYRALAYEDSVIYSKRYELSRLPSNTELETDLRKITSFYSEYVSQRDLLTADTDFSVAVGEVEEGKRLLRSHYVRERNPKIIRAAKQAALQKNKELRCEICNFCFIENYNGRTENYIEGHHKKAVSEMREGDRTRVEDIALLCSNCHRAIHAKWPYISVEELKEIFEIQKNLRDKKLSTH